MSNPKIRGRMAGETQAAAMERVTALSSHRRAIEEALDRVTGSAAFQSSRRGQEFLRYIVGHALAGELDQLKERCIGANLFGRPADYDTGTDSVVRGAATELRKRLAAYYAQAAEEDPVVFELPAGSYIPEIHLERSGRRPLPVSAEIPPRTEPGWRLGAREILAWCLAALLALLWAGSMLTRSESPQTRALGVLPWAALFEGGQTPRLILSDSAMGALRVFKPFPASIEDYANRRFLSPPAGLRPELVGAWNKISAKGFTSLASARIAADYAPLAVAAGRVPVIRSARDLNLSDFHHGDSFILLGNNSSNPWVELFHDQMDFLMRFDPDRATTVEIRHRRPGDPASVASSVSSGTTGEAYATLALVNGLEGRGRVLIAQGTNSEGTELAGALALNASSLANELRRCGIDPANPAGRFEILLKLNATAGSALASQVLATRCSAGK